MQIGVQAHLNGIVWMIFSKNSEGGGGGGGIIYPTNYVADFFQSKR